MTSSNAVHRITEQEAGRNLKDHLIQPVLSKTQSRKDSPTPYPAAESYRSNVVEPTTSPGSLFQWLIIPTVKNFPLVSNHNLIRINFYPLPSSSHVGPCKKGVSMYVVATL